MSAPESTHQDLELETRWSIWYDKKQKHPKTPSLSATPANPVLEQTKSHSAEDWKNNLQKIGCFTTVLGFWNFHTWMKKPSELQSGMNLYYFRNDEEPMWETFPNGGCWIIRFHKNHSSTGVIDRVWEELLLAAIGEQFRTPELVGVSLSVRASSKTVSHIMSIWNRDTVNKKAAQFRIGERLKVLLHLDPSSTIEYKFFSKALEDGSTFRGAQQYTYVPA